MKTVLVTGGTIRLGQAIADRLRREGWHVLTTSHRADASADFIVDLADPSGPQKLFAAAKQKLGGSPPDALVNNAALFVGDPAQIAALNFDAPRQLTTLMSVRTSGVGAVVNILDAAVEKGASCAGEAYRVSKRALRDWTCASARQFAATLRVNGVAPGPVLVPTEVHEPAGKTVLARRPTPEDVAAAVAFLLSAESTTGVILPVDGGQHLLS